ncbi:hypothetical protein BCV70DRAFT_51979 [Testicularia cyperi]|uniref:Uncharacterized protein n=1 Tax=Testicularia cyperi TaxID=1882483 RepID=A0A317XU64_9BASI|nr:hypothetical protein BCV70DRAFT_51979 [Testicularia cyperi]
MVALPAANCLPSDPVEASSVSRLFPHPPAPAPLSDISAATSPLLTSPPRTPGAISVKSATSPAYERSNPVSSPTSGSRVGVSSTSPPKSLGHSRTVSPDGHALSAIAVNTANRSASGSRPMSASSLATGFLGQAAGFATPASAGLAPSEPHTPHTPSIFERDIEHRDATHIMTKQEAIDVAIPSVLDDAVEAIIEDDAEIEVVAPQNPAPPLALSSAALSVHSGASSPGMASSPSPPLSASGGLDAPPGSMAAQIAEKLAPRSGALSDDAKSAGVATTAAPGTASPSAAGAGRKPLGHRRPGSDADSSASFRSRSPQNARVHEVLESSPVRSRASASPVAGVPSSLAAAVSQAQMSLSTPAPITSSSSPMPTATAFPSLPLPNPYRSSSPNLPAMALPSLAAGADAGRPAASSLSIDGAIISGSEVATLDHSLDSIADVLAAHDAEQAASPYVPRSPAPPSATSGSGSPVMERSRARQAGSNATMANPATVGGARSGPPGTLGLPSSGLGVFNTGESLFQALASGSPSPSAEKRRLSFFSYADILNENKGEVMDFQGVVRHAAERDEQQHGHSYIASAPVGIETFSQPSIMQQLGQGGSGMSRSASTSAAVSPRLAGHPSTGTHTPSRGRRDLLENRALSNRLDSLQLATESKLRKV